MADPSNTTLQISTDPAFGTLALNEETEYKTSRAFTAQELPYGVNLYARVKHTHPETGASNWSSAVQFKLTIPNTVIGICLDLSNKSWNWIDEIGNKLTSFDWQSHEIFTRITMVTEDSARSPVTMTRFPLFYIKTATNGPVGTFANGKKCWWISAQDRPGFRPHPAFKRSTQQVNGKYKISPHIDIMTFCGFAESVGGRDTIGSKRGATVRNNISHNDILTYANNRNDVSAGQTGWHVMDVWELSMLKILALIMTASGDTQASFGDNASGTSYPKAGSTNARMIFKGTHSNPQVSIEDLWRCWWHHVDRIGSGNLFSPMNNVAIPGVSLPNQSDGWYHDVRTGSFTIGDHTHDLMEVFIKPENASAGSEANAIIKDYDYSDADSAYLFGGRWGDGSYAGLFFFSDSYLDYRSSHCAGRLAKY